ncbi:MAG: FAD-dependent oxidoreductase [Thiolinea sp.]
MRIAIIGTGIAGNVAAYHLQREHDITVFEQNSHVGGHTHTHDIQAERDHAIDTGFIVFNDWTYPQFIALLEELGVASQPTEMSFSVKCERTGLEYNGNTLNSLFAQRRNLFSPRFHRMIRDILRFNREGHAFVCEHAVQTSSLSLGDFLQQGRYSPQFIHQYIVPMGAAIWSADPKVMFEFPAQFFLRFFANHGLLSVNDRPQWRVIKGGSSAYLQPLTAGFREHVRTDCPVTAVQRHADHVDIVTARYGKERFDCVFIATHSDQALKLLEQPSLDEQNVLKAIPYQDNEVVLHTDTSVLPRRRLAWASWNYHLPRQPQQRVAVTYNMNILQGLQAQDTYCVTLNDRARIDEKKIIKTLHYQHPLFTPQGVSAQSRQRAVNGVQRTYFCGPGGATVFMKMVWSVP